jgi:hypothetical protein
MTKQEARNAGQERGINFANGISEDILRNDLDAYRDDIKARANFEAREAGFRVESTNCLAFIDAFVHAANTRFLGRRSDLPDIKIAQRTAWIIRSLARLKENASATIASFTESVAKNPAYAFEWSDGAFKAAAMLDVVARLEHGRDESNMSYADLYAHFRKDVMRNARHASHSTSMPSNLMNEYKLAAQAEVVELLEGLMAV